MRVSAIVFAWAALGSVAFAQPAAPNPQQAAAEIQRLGGRAYLDAAGKAESVSLTGDQFGDAQLSLLAAFPEVKIVYLDDSQVTDAGLPRLQNLGNLTELYLRNTNVTPQGLATFKQARPGVFVQYSPRSGFEPMKLAFAALMVVPLIGGIALVALARRKRAHLAPRQLGRTYAAGGLLVVASVVFIVIARLQAIGFGVNLANLFD